MSSAEMGKFNISPDEDSSSYSSNSNDFSYPYPTKPAAMKRSGGSAGHGARRAGTERGRSRRRDVRAVRRALGRLSPAGGWRDFLAF